MRFCPKTLLSLIFLLVISTANFAAHIVGGDFSYRHLRDDTYEIKMKMYRDCGGGGASFDQTLVVGIFDKQTNQRIKTISIPRKQIYPIRFNTGCTSPQLRCVEVGIFFAEFTMPKAQFNNSEGYYVQWERCCRNDIIKNIIDPGGTPMAFYMEMPSPYPNNGNFRLNNSPEFRRDPLNYLCVDEPFKYDFKVWDGDGDELRIKAFNPLAGGYTSQFRPQPQTGPAPYTDVDWQVGYGPNFPNYMDGNPDLFVDDDSAFIYLVPREIGVYVISVLCEEYREGVKIGEIRRELQLEVLNCPPRSKPVITTNFAGQNNTVEARVNQRACVNIIGADGDAAEIIKFRIDTVGMYKLFGSSVTLSPSNIAGQSSIEAQLCWTPTCPIDTGDGAFIDVIVFDNSCPFTQDDTVRVKFLLLQQPNNQPQIQTNVVTPEITVRVGETTCFLIQGTDLDMGDDLNVEVIQEGQVDIFSMGATLTPSTIGGIGNVSGQFCWTPDCATNITEPIDLKFIITDNACPISGSDTVSVRIVYASAPNQVPTIVAEGISVGANNVVAANLDQQNCFFVFAEDLDPDDVIDLFWKNVNYDFFANGAQVVTVDNFPNAKRIQFCWTPTCDNFTGGEDLYIDFLTRDNKCGNEKFDTVRMTFKYQLPPNDQAAIIRPDSAFYYVDAGYSRTVDVLGEDADAGDELLLSARPLFGPEIPIRIQMPTATGFGSVTSDLSVYADCGAEPNVLYPIEITLLSNITCDYKDTVTSIVNFLVNPLEEYSGPLIPNAFSPNNDGNNDYFKIYLSTRSICPDDFEIKIYDRWGQAVYESKDPSFAWNAPDMQAGAYIYFIQIGEVKYSGFVALVR